MLIRYFVIVISAIWLSGCTGSSGLLTPDKKVKKEYFTGGKLRSELIMSDETEQNGVLKEYGYEGELLKVTTIKNGQKNGDEIWYDKSGRVLQKIPYTQGQVNGVLEAYYKDGKKMFAITFANGVRQGSATKYNKEGTKIDEAWYENDKLMR